MLPSLFVSHGSPEIAIMQNSTTQFLEQLPSLFSTPKYILVISAHWLTNEPTILSNENPTIMYDFYGFSSKLYEQHYAMKNSMKKVNDIISLFQAHNINLKQDAKRDYDHGVWIPLKCMYPQANIPVIQLSLPMSYSIDQLISLGEILQTLRKETLIISSGNMTHNLKDLNWSNINASVDEQASLFRNWIIEKIEIADMKSLKNFIKDAPFTQKNHPTLEHFLPLFISLGTSYSKIGKSMNNVFMYGNLSMDTILFKE